MKGALADKENEYEYVIVLLNDFICMSKAKGGYTMYNFGGESIFLEGECRTL